MVHATVGMKKSEPNLLNAVAGAVGQAINEPRVKVTLC